MIRMKVPEGPNGQQWMDFAGTGNAVRAFAICATQKWAWEVDYSQATREEALAWFGAEMAIRTQLCLEGGCQVRVNGNPVTNSAEVLSAIQNYPGGEFNHRIDAEGNLDIALTGGVGSN